MESPNSFFLSRTWASVSSKECSGGWLGVGVEVEVVVEFSEGEPSGKISVPFEEGLCEGRWDC